MKCSYIIDWKEDDKKCAPVACGEKSPAWAPVVEDDHGFLVPLCVTHFRVMLTKNALDYEASQHEEIQ